LTSKKLLILIIGFLIFIFIYNNNLIRKFYNIFTIHHEARLIKKSGYCSGESVGYLKYLKNKYDFKFNPQVINFEDTVPNSNWPIYDNNLKDNENYKILLNYPKKIFMVFKPLGNFFFSKHNAMHQKGIIEILFNLNQEKIKINSKILIYLEDLENNSKNIIYESELDQFISNNIPIPINFETSKINNIYKRIYIGMPGLTNDQRSKINKITLNLEHQFELSNFEIIDKHKNCYYIYG